MSEDDKKKLLTLRKNLQRELISAAESGNLSVVQAILNVDKDVADLPLVESFIPCLAYAFKNGHKECVRYIIDGILPLEPPDGMRNWNFLQPPGKIERSVSDVGTFLLTTAARLGRLDSVEKLIEAGVDVNKITADGSAVYWATTESQFACLRILVKAGADPNVACEGGRFAALPAVKSLECAKILVENGANVNTPDDTEWTALYNAVRRGNFEIAKFLLEHEADTEMFYPPLCTAVEAGHAGLVELLLDHGAELNGSATEGWTALSLAAQNGHLYILRLLLKRGADPNARDADSRTALHHLATASKKVSNWEELSNCIRLLAARHVNLNLRDRGGNTPLSLAMEIKDLRMVELLLKYGATSIGRIAGQISAKRFAQAGVGEVADVFKAHFRKVKMRRFKGVVRFIIMARRHREAFYRHRYAKVGAESFATLKRKRENFEVGDTVTAANLDTNNTSSSEEKQQS